MDNLKRFRAVTLLLLMVFFLSACATQKSNIKSSVMEYLYPKSDNAYTEPSIPHLKLPLRIGIAFVPESKSNSRMHNFWVGTVQGGMLTEATKHKLLERVSESFRELDYVGSIEVIPTGYLTPGGSFSNLEQIKTMYGIDVIALVSYDQVQFTDEGFLSLSYWTIVGAYIVSGEKNDTNTLIDTVVYDISSKKLLFRAPGTSQVRGRSTPVNLSEELRQDSNEGFEKATNEMIFNLKEKLAHFKSTLKKDPSKAKITHRAGYTGGGGSFGLFDFLLLLSIIFFIRQRNSLKKVST